MASPAEISARTARRCLRRTLPSGVLAQDRFNVHLREQLVPEFPIHFRTIGREAAGETSCNVDFVAVADDLGCAYFVELKTDGLSRRDVQDDYLGDAAARGMPALLAGVIQIAGASGQKRKYLHLLQLLQAVGLLAIPPTIRERHQNPSLRGLANDLAAVRIAVSHCPIRLVYLQPKSRGDDEIGFAEFARWMERFPDAFSARFRESLVTWSDSTAGDYVE